MAVTHYVLGTPPDCQQSIHLQMPFLVMRSARLAAASTDLQVMYIGPSSSPWLVNTAIR